MFNKKSFILGCASLLLAGGLAGCGGGGVDKGDLLYWCTAMDNAVMDDIVEAFKADNPDYADKNFKRGNLPEGEIYKKLHSNWEDAADVMLMADDNIRAGVEAEEILVIDEEKDYVRQNDGEEGLNAASVDGHLGGFPYRGDNCPLPHYDTNLFPSGDTALNTLEGMLAKCKANGKKLYLDLTTGWYGACVLATAGVTFKAGKSANNPDQTVLLTDIVDKADAAGDVLQALKDLYNEYDDVWEVSSKAAAIEGGFQDDKIGVAWLHNDLATINANAAHEVTVCSWPTLKVGNANKPMKTIAGYKVACVKDQPEGERLDLAKVFAKYIASKKAQKMRIEECGYGPSNVELMDSDEAKALPFVKIVGEMSKAGRLVAQGPSTTGEFWDPVADLCGLIVNGEETWGDYQDAADAAASLALRDGWEAL